MSTDIERKFDLIYPLACSVAAAIERFDTLTPGDLGRAEATLQHMARQLKKAVDHISPDTE